MSKNLRFGWVAYNAILCCLLARNGFTGPVRIVEGENGLRDTVMRGDLDFQRLLDFSGWRIPQTRHKSLCLNGGSQGHVSATLALVRENDLKPEDIVSVRIKASRHESHHTTSLPKKYPRNAETADHSAFYANAIAIKERVFGPDSFQPEKFTDPVVLDLIEKITVEYDPGLGESGFQGISEITTKDGRRLRKHIANPHGFGDDPLTDKELEEKFREMATKYLSEKQIGRIFETIWNIERLEDIRQLTKLLVFPSA
jgi:2-methylcitrate dehydratase